MFEWMVTVEINGKEYLERICYSKEKAEAVAKEMNDKNNNRIYKVKKGSDKF